MYYKLGGKGGKEPVLCEDLHEWAKWFNEADNRHIAVDHVNTKEGVVRVSTVFLGTDYAFGMGGKPVLFETMIFGGVHDQECVRYHTWEDAEQGHADFLRLLKSK